MISLEKATAIARRYPSPTHLIEAYRYAKLEKVLCHIDPDQNNTLDQVGGIRMKLAHVFGIKRGLGVQKSP